MSEQPGNGYTRVSLRTSVTYPAVEGSWDALASFSARPSDGHIRPEVTFPEGKAAGWGWVTFAVIYDNAPPRTALDFVRASNRWPKPYSTALWAGPIP